MNHTKSQFCTLIKDSENLIISQDFRLTLVLTAMKSLLAPVSQWQSTLKPQALSNFKTHAHMHKHTCNHMQKTDAYSPKYVAFALGGHLESQNRWTNGRTQLSSAHQQKPCLTDLVDWSAYKTTTSWPGVQDSLEDRAHLNNNIVILNS